MLYLQVIVVHEPIYDVLLGKPFKLISELATKTYANGSTIVDLTEPASRVSVRLPTHSRLPRQYLFDEPTTIEQVFAQTTERIERMNKRPKYFGTRSAGFRL